MLGALPGRFGHCPRGLEPSWREPVDLGRALVEAFLTNERINQVLLDLIEPGIWDASDKRWKEVAGA